MKKTDMVMTKAKETKSTIVYKNADAVVTSIYIDKSALGDTPPEKIKLTIELAK